MQPTDPRLAELYDLDNPDGPDHDYFRAVVEREQPDTLVDLGCGTGLLTVTLCAPGRTVVGVDPDGAMLNIARARPESTNVQWVSGHSTAIAEAVGGTDTGVDVVVMSGNVAQHLVPGEWERTLADVARALRPGGLLVFETRNPAGEAWRSWTPHETQTTRDTAHGPLTEWMSASPPDPNGTVILTATNRWEDTGEEVEMHVPLTFRTLVTLMRDLSAAGLRIEHVWGGWHSESATPDAPLIVIEARRS